MQLRLRTLLFLAFVVALGSLPAAAPMQSQLVREERIVSVSGVRETWRLQWQAPPELDCMMDLAITCPCQPFAYAEKGKLDLVRLRNGKEFDRLSLSPLFGDSKAMLQRWPFNDDDPEHWRDFDEEKWMKNELPRIQKRSPATIMQPADYDHDGNATEFYLATEALPCGKTTGVLVGVSRNNNRLHAFSSVDSPHTPLDLQGHEWEALRKSSGPTTVLDWNCDDHGSEHEVYREVQAQAGSIRVRQYDYQCGPNGRGQLLESKYR